MSLVLRATVTFYPFIRSAKILRDLFYERHRAGRNPVSASNKKARASSAYFSRRSLVGVRQASGYPGNRPGILDHLQGRRSGLTSRIRVATPPTPALSRFTSWDPAWRIGFEAYTTASKSIACFAPTMCGKGIYPEGDKARGNKANRSAAVRQILRIRVDVCRWRTSLPTIVGGQRDAIVRFATLSLPLGRRYKCDASSYKARENVYEMRGRVYIYFPGRTSGRLSLQRQRSTVLRN